MSDHPGGGQSAELAISLPADDARGGVEKLQAWFDAEAAERGLLGMSFTPGSDREVSHDEAATVALAMLNWRGEPAPALDTGPSALPRDEK